MQYHDQFALVALGLLLLLSPPRTNPMVCWTFVGKLPPGQGWSWDQHRLLNSVPGEKYPRFTRSHFTITYVLKNAFAGKPQVGLLPVILVNFFFPRELISWPSSAPTKPLQSPSFVAVRDFEFPMLQESGKKKSPTWLSKTKWYFSHTDSETLSMVF